MLHKKKKTIRNKWELNHIHNKSGNMNRTSVERQHPAKRYAELGIGSFPLNDGESAESLTVRTRATKINSL